MRHSTDDLRWGRTDGMEPQAVHSHTALSRKQRRDRARQERRREEAQLAARQLRKRRARRLGLVAAGAILAVAGVVLVIGGQSSRGGGGQAGSSISDAGMVSAEFAGISQADMTLGNATAPVTIHEYADLQCTACQAFASSTLPTVIDTLVKTGRAKMVFHTWPIIDQTDSVAAAKASYAAARQGRAWQFIELFYRNQGAERSGYVTESFLENLARAAGLDVARFNVDRAAPAATQRVGLDARQAISHGFQGTPSFSVAGPRGTRVLQLGASGDAQPFTDAAQAVS